MTITRERQSHPSEREAGRGRNPCICTGFRQGIWDFCGGYDVALSNAVIREKDMA